MTSVKKGNEKICETCGETENVKYCEKHDENHCEDHWGLGNCY